MSPAHAVPSSLSSSKSNEINVVVAATTVSLLVVVELPDVGCGDDGEEVLMLGL